MPKPVLFAVTGRVDLGDCMYLKAIDHVKMIIADVTADFVMIEEINSLSNVPVKLYF